MVYNNGLYVIGQGSFSGVNLPLVISGFSCSYLNADATLPVPSPKQWSAAGLELQSKSLEVGGDVGVAVAGAPPQLCLFWQNNGFLAAGFNPQLPLEKTFAASAGYTLLDAHGNQFPANKNSVYPVSATALDDDRILVATFFDKPPDGGSGPVLYVGIFQVSQMQPPTGSGNGTWQASSFPATQPFWYGDWTFPLTQLQSVSGAGGLKSLGTHLSIEWYSRSKRHFLGWLHFVGWQQ